VPDRKLTNRVEKRSSREGETQSEKGKLKSYAERGWVEGTQPLDSGKTQKKGEIERRSKYLRGTVKKMGNRLVLLVRRKGWVHRGLVHGLNFSK